MNVLASWRPCCQESRAVSAAPYAPISSAMSGQTTGRPMSVSSAFCTAGLRKVPPCTTICSPKNGRIGDLEHLVQGVLDHRVSQPGGDIADLGAFAQGLLDARVHKDRAARAQVVGRLRAAGQRGEIGDVVAHIAGKSFDEGAAAGGAGFIDLDVLDLPVLDEDGLHILPADIQDEGDLRVEGLGGAEMRQGLHQPLVDAEGGADQVFAVAGDRAAGDVRLQPELLEALAHALQTRLGGADGVAAVAGVVAVRHPAVRNR